jgi:amidophosphoribosyltransferase
MTQEVKHYCGLFGVVNHPSAAQLTYLGLYAQQHRGQESAGICVADGTQIKRTAGMGVVTQAIGESELSGMLGHTAIGHVRYSTTGSSSATNAQPLLVDCAIGQVAIAHNGNLVNAEATRHEYEREGHIFVTTSDTEVVLHMLADRQFAEQPDPLSAVLRHLSGSYCFLLIYPDRIEAARDPAGNRPLCIGKIGDSWCVASESCAFDIVDAEYVRDVQPGEIVTLSATGMRSRRFVEESHDSLAHCVFEHVYFADPASMVFGEKRAQSPLRDGAAVGSRSPSRWRCRDCRAKLCPLCGLGFSRRSGDSVRPWLYNQSLRRPIVYSAFADDPRPDGEDEAQPDPGQCWRQAAGGG